MDKTLRNVLIFSALAVVAVIAYKKFYAVKDEPVEPSEGDGTTVIDPEIAGGEPRTAPTVEDEKPKVLPSSFQIAHTIFTLDGDTAFMMRLGDEKKRITKEQYQSLYEKKTTATPVDITTITGIAERVNTDVGTQLGISQLNKFRLRSNTTMRGSYSLAKIRRKAPMENEQEHIKRLASACNGNANCKSFNTSGELFTDGESRNSIMDLTNNLYIKN